MISILAFSSILGCVELQFINQKISSRQTLTRLHKAQRKKSLTCSHFSTNSFYFFSLFYFFTMFPLSLFLHVKFYSEMFYSLFKHTEKKIFKNNSTVHAPFYFFFSRFVLSHSHSSFYPKTCSTQILWSSIIILHHYRHIPVKESFSLSFPFLFLFPVFCLLHFFFFLFTQLRTLNFQFFFKIFIFIFIFILIFNFWKFFCF